ncbi:MAG: two-component sensor histidine kinase [Planctomycetaceae bacterium]|nr:two-component sensor histidine kinase [Planctomycetaceae bacterium]
MTDSEPKRPFSFSDSVCQISSHGQQPVKIGTVPDPRTRELQAESITVQIRWFGLCVGYLYVNLAGHPDGRLPLNLMLTLGVVYALLDTLISIRQRLLFPNYRIGISVMEALFIAMLCHFDEGVESPFRFYYFLSILVCAIRHSPRTTVATLSVHSTSYIILGLYADVTDRDKIVAMVLTLVFLGWAAWAIIALTSLRKSVEQKLALVNAELRQNQELLEGRIARRTRELQESQALLVQQEKQAAFGLLAAGIAHEVGNPLASISGIVQILKRKIQDEYIGERLEMVDGQLTRIQKILRELTGFSRPTNQQESNIDVHSAINDALNIAKYYKRWKGKKVETRFSPAIPPTRTIHDQLVQVLLNLFLNALDATEEGATITISTALVGTEEDRPFITIRVRDEGHGIVPEEQDQIFQPYFTTKSTGTGLGLFVCRQLAQHALGGNIRLVESGARGTEFEVSLPVKQ